MLLLLLLQLQLILTGPNRGYYGLYYIICFYFTGFKRVLRPPSFSLSPQSRQACAFLLPFRYVEQASSTPPRRHAWGFCLFCRPAPPPPTPSGMKSSQDYGPSRPREGPKQRSSPGYPSPRKRNIITDYVGSASRPGGSKLVAANGGRHQPRQRVIMKSTWQTNRVKWRQPRQVVKKRLGGRMRAAEVHTSHGDGAASGGRNQGCQRGR